MGILADLFVSNDDLAGKYFESQQGEREAHLGRYMPVELRNLTDLEFSTLNAILKKEEWIYERHGLESVAVINAGEAWLFKFPSTYLNVLAKLNTPEIIHFAMLWAKTEELSRWNIADTANILSALVTLAKDTLAKNKSLYLFGSL